MRVTVTVETEYRAESAPLEPADQAFPEVLVMDVAAVKAADVGSPPGNAGKTHIQTDAQLIPHGAEAGLNVSGPHQRAVFLTSGPGAAQQIDHLFLTGFCHAVKESLGMHHGINVANL